MTLLARAAAACGLICFGIAAATPAGAQSQIQPIIIRPDTIHQNCQIYLKHQRQPAAVQGQADFGQRRLPLRLYARNGDAPRGPTLIGLRVSGADCIITPAGLGGCR